MPDAALNEIFRQIAAIWPVSHALCNSFLKAVKKGLTCLHHSQLADWVKTILAAYESGGLHQTRQLLERVEETFLCTIRGETGISLAEVTGRLQPYATGLAGHPLELIPGQEVYTDTAAVYLPPRIAVFPKQTDNFLLYKLIISFQWAFTAIGTFSLHLPEGSPAITAATRRQRTAPPPACTGLNDYFNLFAKPAVAAHLFHLGETARATTFLRERLPGLMRESGPIFQALARTIPRSAGGSTGDLQRTILLRAAQDTGETPSAPHPVTSLFDGLFREDATSQDSACFATKAYARFLDQAGEPAPPIIFQGVLRPAEVLAVQRKKRAAAKEQFIEALAAVINAQTPQDAPVEKEKGEAQGTGVPELEGQTAAVIPPEGAGKDTPDTKPQGEKTLEFITIDDSHIDLPDTLKKLAREIVEDLGQIPSQYISSAKQAAGKGLAQGNAPPPQEGEPLAGANLFIFDEWDYRRAGFRKNWCSLAVKKIIPVAGTFVGNTLERYRGHLTRLKRQFEMMRNQERFVRRQKDGDEIDLDALIETLADIKAGLSPSEELYIRLARDKRNISALFLVDMSSSTEGWVNTALKEALILMCEALEVLGDTYGIYGFSGMRRTRSELFRIKDLAEPYNDEVKGRIAAIAPQEYTRMGPPIRHLTRLLAESEARIKLLITLSDGKPEDYDDYKGEYAIEDTRHALIEAKAQGVHPFCITIDKQAHAYLPHMYGEVNYICIDEVGKLPNRIPEIYRGLTS
ncbi:MAG: VWA domain-containing protein [Deltaproteobacteria bacterium]|uniref:nitric oxide reductase activation protein NorD n=1 Tax=Hydrosulfovibrio ferrireducens TaxID=2934181 RepID=UPI0011F62C4E|nr:MAG: VWA domain-containing protein [Deltaproteobacteria bacterium]